MNKHIFPAKFTQILLRFILKQVAADNQAALFDIKTPLLLRLAAEEIAIKNLKTILENVSMLDNPDKQMDKLAQLLQDYNSREPEQAKHITTNTLMHLCQSTIQHGCIIPLANLDAYTTWLVFLNEIKKVYVPDFIGLMMAFKQEKKMLPLPEDFFGEFLNFLGQMSTLSLTDTTEILHNYIHLCTLIIQNKESNKMSEAYVAQMMSPTTIDALELSEKLTLQKNIIDQDYKAFTLTQEAQFMSCLMFQALNHPLFSKPFSLEYYNHYHQKKGVFFSTRESILSSLWANPNLSHVLQPSDQKIDQLKNQKSTSGKSSPSSSKSSSLEFSFARKKRTKSKSSIKVTTPPSPHHQPGLSSSLPLVEEDEDAKKTDIKNMKELEEKLDSLFITAPSTPETGTSTPDSPVPSKPKRLKNHKRAIEIPPTPVPTIVAFTPNYEEKSKKRVKRAVSLQLSRNDVDKALQPD